MNEKSDNAEKQKKTVTIVVNGTPKEWEKTLISFDEVVILAFGSISNNPNVCYTVTYKRGHGNKPEGMLDKGDSVKVKDKMQFNVTETNKS